MTRVLALGLVVLSGCVVHERTVVREPPPMVVAVTTFDAHLAPYGTWVVVPTYGRVWRPAVQAVGLDFYPYGTGGTWVFTDAGWMFDSTYPFGWAVFHYGRWVFVSGAGWLWIPGDTWAPAWVVWRTGGEWVGWAPLGPAGPPPFRPEHWCFVATMHFTVAHAHQHHARSDNFHRAVAVTQPAPGFGPRPTSVSSATRRPVVPVPMSAVPSAGRRVPPPPPPTTAIMPPGTPPPPGPGAPGAPPPPTTGQVAPGTPPPPTTAMPPLGTPPPPGAGAAGMPPPPPPPTGRVSPGTPPPPPGRTGIATPPQMPPAPERAQPPRPGGWVAPGAPPPPAPRGEPLRVPAPVPRDSGRVLAPGPMPQPPAAAGATPGQREEKKKKKQAEQGPPPAPGVKRVPAPPPSP